MADVNGMLLHVCVRVWRMCFLVCFMWKFLKFLLWLVTCLILSQLDITFTEKIWQCSWLCPQLTLHWQEWVKMFFFFGQLVNSCVRRIFWPDFCYMVKLTEVGLSITLITASSSWICTFVCWKLGMNEIKRELWHNTQFWRTLDKNSIAKMRMVLIFNKTVNVFITA